MHKNRGMLLEKIIQQSINYYIEQKIAFIEKRPLNIKFSSVKLINNKKTLNNAFISSKSTVDFYGIYKGKYISFEAKSTEESYLPIHNFKNHQHEHLLFINSLGGIAFYIIYFKNANQFYYIKAKEIVLKGKTRIELEEIKKKGKKLKIIFPGIIDFLN